MASTPSLSQSDVTTYPALFRRVKETLIEGQRRIESEKVRTYWQTGQLIQTHILKNKSRADYGAEVMARLAQDLGVSYDLLYRCVKFVQAYPNQKILVARPEFSWTHYKKFITVADRQERTLLEDATIKGGWTSRELGARIKLERSASEEEDASVLPADKAPVLAPLVPLRGALYVYKVLKPKLFSGGSELVVDLGFEITRDVGPGLLKGLSEGDIIVSRPGSGEGGYSFSRITQADLIGLASGVRCLVTGVKLGQKADLLYTYQAFVERVVDGDTLKVRVDLGFGVWIRETLRLRGIDCPELKTKEGDAAKAFVQSLIKEADRIVIRSSRSDKYGRYVADVFIATAEGGEDVFLNGLLLEKSFAERYAD